MSYSSSIGLSVHYNDVRLIVLIMYHLLYSWRESKIASNFQIRLSVPKMELQIIAWIHGLGFDT